MSTRFYFVKSGAFYCSKESIEEWVKERGDAHMFVDRKTALRFADRVRCSPRQFGGMNERARVVSVAAPREAKKERGEEAKRAKKAIGDAIEDELTPEERKNVEMHHTLALIHGFNEMATKAITLGEKAYYRLARDAAEKRFNALGGQINRTEEHSPVLIIPGYVPEIRFDARDLEMMRACVTEHDAKQAMLIQAGEAESEAQ